MKVWYKWKLRKQCFKQTPNINAELKAFAAKLLRKDQVNPIGLLRKENGSLIDDLLACLVSQWHLILITFYLLTLVNKIYPKINPQLKTNLLKWTVLFHALQKWTTSQAIRMPEFISGLRTHSLVWSNQLTLISWSAKLRPLSKGHWKTRFVQLNPQSNP